MRAVLLLACLAVLANASQVAGIGEVCNALGVAGVCSSTPCEGTTIVGLCRGAANIKCCLPKVADPKSAAAANIAQPNAPTPVAAQLPVEGYQCKAFGAIGTCKTEATCTNGRAYYGFCAGANNVKCCVPAVTMSSFVSMIERRAITQTAAPRLTEQEHQTKWAAFKALHRKTYSSPAVEAQRYAQFKANRVRIVAKNDLTGQGEAIYRSSSPFADIDPDVFRASFLNNKDATALQAMMLEMQTENAVQAEHLGESVLLEADSEVDAEADSEADSEAEIDAELDAEAEAEAGADHDAEADSEVDTFSSSPNPKCDAAGGVCKSRASCTGVIQAGKCAGTNYCCVGAAPIPSVPDTATLSGDAACGATKGVCMDAGDCTTYGGKQGSTACTNVKSICCALPAVPKKQQDLPSRLRSVQGTLTIDYRGIQSPIRNQGQCGSCWAHAAMEVYESAGVRAGKWDKNMVYSIQQVQDCTEQGNFGCGGGIAEYGLAYLTKHKPAIEAAYPYTAKQGSCQNAAPGAQAALLTSYGYVNSLAPACQYEKCDPNRMKEALEKYGPLLVSVDASHWQFYDSDKIFPDADCTGQTNHAVVVCGYGSEVDPVTKKSQNFWLIRNSWSKNWNEAGYIRLNAGGILSGCSVHKIPRYAIF